VLPPHYLGGEGIVLSRGLPHAHPRAVLPHRDVLQVRTTWGIKGGSKTAAGCLPCRRPPLKRLEGRFGGGHVQGAERLGRAGHSNTLGSPWIPLEICYDVLQPCHFHRRQLCSLLSPPRASHPGGEFLHRHGVSKREEDGLRATPEMAIRPFRGRPVCRG
jgi:hypothetical protein